jgi:hypothetical protein
VKRLADAKRLAGAVAKRLAASDAVVKRLAGAVAKRRRGWQMQMQ